MVLFHIPVDSHAMDKYNFDLCVSSLGMYVEQLMSKNKHS